MLRDGASAFVTSAAGPIGAHTAAARVGSRGARSRSADGGPAERHGRGRTHRGSCQIASIPHSTGEELPVAECARRDFVFVVVDAALLAASADLRPGEILDAGTGRQSTNDELVSALARASGVDVRTRYGAFARRPRERPTWVADMKIERLLGWRATHTLEAGLRKTYEWFRSERATVG